MGVYDDVTRFFTRQDKPQKKRRKRSFCDKMGRFPGTMVGGIDAARLDRFAASWSAMPVTPDEQIRLYWRVLVARSRDMTINDPYMARYVRSCRANIVGHGPQLRCSVKKNNGKDDRRINEAVLQSWKDWTEDPNACDLTGQQSFVMLTNAVVHSMVVDGEAFVKVTDGGPDGTQLQLIDAVRCPHDYDVDDTGNGNFIRSGIEFSPYGKPVAYLFSAETSTGSYYGIDGLSYTRVPAEQIYHVYRKTMADQKRGFPWATASLDYLKNLKEFERNALINARVGAAKMGFFTSKEDDPEGTERDYDDGNPSFSAEPGVISELPAGVDFKTFDPAFPDNAYGPFIKTNLRAASSGMGVNYTSLGNDLEGVNYSSIRAGMLDERELWKEDQKLLIEQFVLPVFKRWLRTALPRDRVIGNKNFKAPFERLTDIIRAVTFIPRRWDWVDPKSDMIGNQKAIESTIKSPQEIIRERGGDPDAVLDEIANWYRKCSDAGIPHEAMQVAAGEQVKATVTDTNGETPNNGE